MPAPRSRCILASIRRSLSRPSKTQADCEMELAGAAALDYAVWHKLRDNRIRHRATDSLCLAKALRQPLDGNVEMTPQQGKFHISHASISFSSSSIISMRQFINPQSVKFEGVKTRCAITEKTEFWGVSGRGRSHRAWQNRRPVRSPSVSCPFPREPHSRAE